MKKKPALQNSHLGTGRSEMVGDQVHQIRYRHAEDGKDYFHDFGPGTVMYVLQGGGLLIEHPDHKLWAT